MPPGCGRWPVEEATREAHTDDLRDPGHPRAARLLVARRQRLRHRRLFAGPRPARACRRRQHDGRRAASVEPPPAHPVRGYPPGRGLDPERAAARRDELRHRPEERQEPDPPAPQRQPASTGFPFQHDPARDRGDDREPVPGARRRGRFPHPVACSRGRSSAPTASSSITSISTTTSCGAAAARSAR